MCVHDQAHEVRLKESITRKYFDGKQPNMKDTVILGEDGLLGSYYCIFERDDTQHIWWDPALLDIKLTVPFWIYEMENAEHRRGVFTAKTKPRKLKE